jgi:hypothetical protein
MSELKIQNRAQAILANNNQQQYQGGMFID